MKAEDSFVAIIFIGLIALIAYTAYMFLTDQFELYMTIAIIVLLGLMLIGLILYIVFGVFYAIKQKDQVHYESGMTLDDVQEVDREMEKKQ